MRSLSILVKQFLLVLSSVILLSLSWKEFLLKNKLDEDAKELIEKCIVGKSLLLNMLALESETTEGYPCYRLLTGLFLSVDVLDCCWHANHGKCCI